MAFLVSPTECTPTATKSEHIVCVLRFVRVPMVQNRGEVSIRGDIVDVYPPASNNPIRIEFYDNTIESLREFDVNSQVSLNVIDRVEILPVREVSPNEIQKGNGLDAIAILANSKSVRLDSNEADLRFRSMLSLLLFIAAILADLSLGRVDSPR